MSSVLVLGSSGFIGSEVSLSLVKKGYKVWGLTRKQENANQLTRNEIIPIVSDVRDVEKWLPIALKVDIIIDTIADLVDFTTPFKVQEALTKVVQERPNTVIVYTSGSLIYGGSENVINENSDYFNHDFSNWRIEIEKGYKKLNAIIIQPTILFGKNQSFSGYFFEAATKSDDTIKIYGNPNLVQGFIHIFDLVRFYELVVEKSHLLKGETLIANSHSENIQDLVLSISKVATSKSSSSKSIKSIEYIPKTSNIFTEALSFNQKLSFSKASLLLGYYPTQPRLTDETERYYDAWLLSKDKDTMISKLIESVVPA